MAHGDAREGKWRGTWRMEWVASTLHTTSEHGVSSITTITTADAYTSAASSRLNWRPRRFKWTHPFRRNTKSGFCACGITFQTQSTLTSWDKIGDIGLNIMFMKNVADSLINYKARELIRHRLWQFNVACVNRSGTEKQSEKVRTSGLKSKADKSCGFIFWLARKIIMVYLEAGQSYQKLISRSPLGKPQKFKTPGKNISRSQVIHFVWQDRKRETSYV
jgi:hypothetical protein